MTLCQNCKNVPYDKSHPTDCCLCYEEKYGWEQHIMQHDSVEYGEIND